jgi:drug/metabolite transporter (DMT)-like permease
LANDGGDTGLGAPVMDRRILVRLAPVVFVLIWSTGFVGAKFGLPYSPPFTLLAIRMSLAAVLLALIAYAVRAPRLNAAQAGRSILIGSLLHGLYLGGVFFGIDRGMPAGVSAVLIALQPIIVTLAAVPLLGERVRSMQVLGLVAGVTGVTLVLVPGLANTKADTITVIGLSAVLVALVASTVGTLIQKGHGHRIPMLHGTALQFATSAVMFTAAALITEDLQIQWAPEFIAVLAWQVLVLSIGAVLLLFTLLRRGTAAQVSSLLYLVPPATALEAWLLFRERLTLMSIAGIAIAALGVWLVQRPARIEAPTTIA